MINPPPKVFVVDDDSAMRDSLAFMFTATGVPVETHASAESFLAVAQPELRGCLVLDLRMPRMSGLELHRQLRSQGVRLPVIILTAHGDVPTAVDEMKLGAFDFLAKPVNRDRLLRRVREALDADRTRQQQDDETADLRRKLATLSPRELQVMDRVAQGHANKKIAFELGLSERTVANHRAHLMEKIGGGNTADLVRKLALVGRAGPAPGGLSADEQRS